MNPRVVHLPFNFPGTTLGVTVWPFIFLAQRTQEMPSARLTLLAAHESVHFRQQAAFAKWGLWLPGLLVWGALYLLCLPVGWNPFRRRWEMEAYTLGSRLDPAEARWMLRRAPYFLWWM